MGRTVGILGAQKTFKIQFCLFSNVMLGNWASIQYFSYERSAYKCYSLGGELSGEQPSQGFVHLDQHLESSSWHKFLLLIYPLFPSKKGSLCHAKVLVWTLSVWLVQSVCDGVTDMSVCHSSIEYWKMVALLITPNCLCINWSCLLLWMVFLLKSPFSPF